MFVKPAAGLTVRFPRTLTLLPPEGHEVPATVFWLRRLAHGDVVRATPPAPLMSPAPSAPAERPKALPPLD